MKAFISYSHQDVKMLEHLHVHLSTLKREGLLNSWVDSDIRAGSEVTNSIFMSLSNSNLFIALVSPFYIASKFCFEIEFAKALELQRDGKIIIVPIIVESCDWKSTEFYKFKALPRDGKPVITWNNLNTAFLDVNQELRKLIQEGTSKKQNPNFADVIPLQSAKNYRVKKDFDSIEKMEYSEKTFKEITGFIKSFTQEIILLDNVKCRIISEGEKDFSCILVNRNKIATETTLTISLAQDEFSLAKTQTEQNCLNFTLKSKELNQRLSFIIANDEFQMFWIQNEFFNLFQSEGQTRYDSVQIADNIWNQLLNSVGIV